MPEYPSDLMMAVVVASTAFVGLTGVILGQLTWTTARSSEQVPAWLRQNLIYSSLAGIVAVFLGILWFVCGSQCVKVSSVFLFVAQVIWFGVPWSQFWLGRARNR